MTKYLQEIYDLDVYAKVADTISNLKKSKTFILNFSIVDHYKAEAHPVWKQFNMHTTVGIILYIIIILL